MQKVAIVYRTIFQYRREFYTQLRDALYKEGVELTLIYGKLTGKEFNTRKDQIELSWAKFIQNKVISIGGKELIWQPCLKELQGMDVVIVEQANKLLLNYYLMLIKGKLGIKFCYWGHGRNMQSGSNDWFNKFKYFFIDKCDWWFAYTYGVKDFLINKGVSSDKITDVQNAIDTRDLHNQYNEIKLEETNALRKELGLNGDCIGIFCGAMYTEKRMGFILETCYEVKKQVPDFQMIFVGSGEDSLIVEEAASKFAWIHYMGPKFGVDRVKYFKVAKLQLMPGAVGLGVLDSFALETPLVTTKQNFHGPEIDYLENGINGVITDDLLTDYTSAVIALLQSDHYSDMVSRCRECANKYTIEEMVSNFKDGILKCLQTN